MGFSEFKYAMERAIIISKSVKIPFFLFLTLCDKRIKAKTLTFTKNVVWENLDVKAIGGGPTDFVGQKTSWSIKIALFLLSAAFFTE